MQITCAAHVCKSKGLKRDPSMHDSEDTGVCVQAAAPTPANLPDAAQRTPLEALLDVARNMFPDNVAAAAVNMNILGIITFSLFFGLCLSTVGDAAEPMIKLVDVSFSALS